MSTVLAQNLLDFVRKDLTKNNDHYRKIKDLNGGQVSLSGVDVIDVPMNNLFVRLNGKWSGGERNFTEKHGEEILAKIRQMAAEVGLHADWDKNEGYIREKIHRDSQGDITSLIFSVITIIVMIICFFSLVSTMGGNIIQQTKEIGVLRCIGMTKRQITLLYVYEGFVLVFSSSLFGIFIGLFVGYTMTAQRALLSNIPIPFEFPWSSFYTILGTSVVMGFLSSFGPARMVVRDRISVIMRSQL